MSSHIFTNNNNNIFVSGNFLRTHIISKHFINVICMKKNYSNMNIQTIFKQLKELQKMTRKSIKLNLISIKFLPCILPWNFTLLRHHLAFRPIFAVFVFNFLSFTRNCGLVFCYVSATVLAQFQSHSFIHDQCV